MNDGKKIYFVPAHFGNLDTEPACRYITQARELLGRKEIEYIETSSLTDLNIILALEKQIAGGEGTAIVIYLITWVDPNVWWIFCNATLRSR
jgi:hypothetical protein